MTAIRSNTTEGRGKQLTLKSKIKRETEENRHVNSSIDIPLEERKKTLTRAADKLLLCDLEKLDSTKKKDINTAAYN